MQLPEFLDNAQPKEIRLTGHRIALAHVVKLYNQGYSAELITAHFPTLPLAIVHRVIAFYLDNQGDVDAHVAEHDQILDRLESQSGQSHPTPSIQELRKRLEVLRNAGQG